VPDVLEVGGESAAAKIGPRLYRKHLLRYGAWVHPNDPAKKLEITPEFAAKLKANFDAAVLDAVPVPGKHTDDWKANHGTTVGLEVHPEKGVYALLQVDDEADKAITEGKLRGVSAGLAEDYLDKQKGQRVGPVLRHVALTNVPYIKHLEGFERVANLSDDEQLILLAEVESPAPPAPPAPPEEEPVDKEKALAFLKEQGIDVEALQAQGATLKAIQDALKQSGVELSEDGGAEKLADALKGLKTKADESTSLSERVATLEKEARRKEAEAKVAPYLRSGIIAPVDKDKFVDFAETNPEMFELSMKDRKPDVMLGELGTSEGPPGESGTNLSDPAKVDEEVARYAKVGKEHGLRTRVPSAA